MVKFRPKEGGNVPVRKLSATHSPHGRAVRTCEMQLSQLGQVAKNVRQGADKVVAGQNKPRHTGRVPVGRHVARNAEPLRKTRIRRGRPSCVVSPLPAVRCLHQDPHSSGGMEVRTWKKLKSASLSRRSQGGEEKHSLVPETKANTRNQHALVMTKMRRCTRDRGRFLLAPSSDSTGSMPSLEKLYCGCATSVLRCAADATPQR